MKQLTYVQRYLVHEFVEDYHDGLMSRRDMVGRVLHITGSAAAAATVLTALGVSSRPELAGAQEATPSTTEPQSPLSVPLDDPSVTTAEITFDSGGETIMAYEARPATGATPAASPAASPVASPATNGGLPLVLVCHENRGLTDHIRDVARRLATEGYVACAVDLLSREGGTAAIADPSQIPALLTEGDDITARHVSDFQAAAAFYEGQEGVNAAALSMIGFCFGGGVTWNAATMMPELRAAAPFYGPHPPLDQVSNIQAAVLGVYSDDPGDFANEGRDELEAALAEAGVTFQINVYPNTQHAFHNDTGPRYNEEQALAAWQDTLAWFAQYGR